MLVAPQRIILPAQLQCRPLRSGSRAGCLRQFLRQLFYDRSRLGTAFGPCQDRGQSGKDRVTGSEFCALVRGTVRLGQHMQPDKP